MAPFGIGQLAIHADVAIDTVRYYERNGLLSPSGRLSSGYRRYGVSELKRLRFIRRAKVLGFSLEDIRELLKHSNNYNVAKIKTKAQAKLADIEQCIVGLLAVADPIKDSAPEAIAALRAAGIRVVMAAGDGRTTAAALAKQLDIDEFCSEVRPQDNSDLVARLKAESRRMAMAGDGINDAPALAAADVGIAVGTGKGVVMSSAQVTLVKRDLRSILRAREISQATVANMKQNLVFAFACNALGVPIAAGVLYPVFGLLLSPMIAALAISLSSVSVVANALRLRGTHPRP